MPSGLNIAHHVARRLAPENTIIAAACKAMAVGADLWEFDVAVTADEQLIVFHDDSVARTTDAAARFPDRAPWTFTMFTPAEICSLDAGSWFVETGPFGQIAAGKMSETDLDSYQGARVPTLQEALLFTKENHYRVNVELKALPASQEAFPVVTAVLELIDRPNMAKNVIISSFNYFRLRQVEEEWPELEVQSLSAGRAPSHWGRITFVLGRTTFRQRAWSWHR